MNSKLMGVVVLVVIASLLLLFGAEPVSAATRNWRFGSNNKIYWDNNCYFYDENRVEVKLGVVSSQCGPTCLANPKCTHFYWYNNGSCMLFGIPKGTTITDAITTSLCGFAIGRSKQTL